MDSIKTEKKVLLFDLDGTLVNTGQGILNGVRYALDTLGADYSGQDLTEFIGPPLLASFEHILSNPEDAKRAVDLYRAQYDTGGWRDCEVYNGIPEALERLCQHGFRLATATAKPEFFARRILEHFKLDAFFTQIVGVLVDGPRETKEDVIRDAMAMCHANEQECIMIGDRRYDLIGAKTMGLDAIGVLWGFGSLKELSKHPHIYLAQTPGDLCEFLTRGA